MKICITAQGATPDAPAEQRFGRAPYFIIMDSENGSFEAIPNPFAGGAGGVGPKAAQVIIDHKVNALISGQLGGNARAVLQVAGIALYTYRAGGSVRDAFGLFSRNALEPME
jgi:predicted Fe-Mo cluster-binding NifX family protein